MTKLTQHIAALGGPASVGRALGCNGQAVSHWQRVGAVPVERVPAMLRLARRLGVSLQAEDLAPTFDWDAIRIPPVPKKRAA